VNSKNKLEDLKLEMLLKRHIRYFNARIALGGKKSPSSVFEFVKNSVQHWALPFVTFPVDGVGTKCNNRCTGSC